MLSHMNQKVDREFGSVEYQGGCVFGDCLEFLYRIIDQYSVLLKRGIKVRICEVFVEDRISHVHDGW